MRRTGFRPVGWALACLLATAKVSGQEPGQLLSTPLAEAFGSAPDLRGLRLSPDGTRISFIRRHSEGYPVVAVYDTRSSEVTVIMAGRLDEYAISWCGWANDERILCSLRFIGLRRNGIRSPRTRLAAVNADGSGSVLLLEQHPLGTRQYQDRIVDWLPDDPEHVLLGLPSLLVRLNIYNSEVELVDSESGVYDWIADEEGTAHLRATVSATNRIWYMREHKDDAWLRFHRTLLTDLDDAFEPIAFDGDSSEVLFFDSHEGRLALFALELGNARSRRLVYAHPTADVTKLHRIGRNNRIVGTVTFEHRPVQHLFDPAVQHLLDRLAPEFPGMTINVVDEDWARRRYLIFVSSEGDAGTYYVFDTEAPELIRFADAFPELGNRPLAPQQSITYQAADGTGIPAYLTLPPEGESLGGVVVPHGDSPSYTYARFDFLAQFLAARGYAVLQSDYRGSAGHGKSWTGTGVFRGWRQAADDVADGARYLVEAGLAEPGRLCVVGWGYGGYAALLSAIEHDSLYQCVVSIAGVTDPTLLARKNFYFVGGRRNQAFIGSGSEVRDEGSPLRRADEIVLPTLLFHPHEDVPVPLEHSLELRNAMRDEGAEVELIEYEHAGHDISPTRYRIDMLARLGAFLDARLGEDIPNFYARNSRVRDRIGIVAFGIDAARPNGICSDARFTGADGGVLRDIEDHRRGRGDDATDCRRLFLEGDIILRNSIAPNFAGNVPAEDQVTIFIDPGQQSGVGIAAVDSETTDSDDGVPVTYVRPGYRIVGVRATGLQYRCTIRMNDAGTNTAEPGYSTRPAPETADVSQVRIPSFAGRYYRLGAAVIDDTLALRVTDASDERVIVDQRALVSAGCG